MTKNILLYGADAGNIPYILKEAKKLQAEFGANEVLALVVGNGEGAKKLENCGVDKIISVSADSAFPETVSAIIKEVMDKYEAGTLVMLNQPFEVEVAGRVSTKLEASCLTDCLTVKKDSDGSYVAEKMLYGGVVVGNYKLTSSSVVVTLNENSCREAYKNEENAVSIYVEETIETKQLKKKVTQTREIEQTVDLKSSRKIVSVGRGINKQEDIALVEGLANTIDAQLGCSRPIVEDFKWLKLERQVGLTGTVVAPDLYVAIGISGQIQHAVGIKDAKIIVAINNNKNAPIFDIADYGIVGDLYEVVPRLQKALESVAVK